MEPMAGTGMLIRACACCLILPAGLLAGCAAPPPSGADQANLAACTQSADAVYQADNENGLARTSQNGLYFAPMPDHAFDSQRMGSLNARNNQIQDCMDNGNPDAALPGQAKLPAPQIIGTPNSP
jgi:hypothetical protein